MLHVYICCHCRELSWVKIHNVDDRYEANRIEGVCSPATPFISIPAPTSMSVHCYTGHFQARLVYYLMNVHTQPRCIYLCRVSTHTHTHTHTHTPQNVSFYCTCIYCIYMLQFICDVVHGMYMFTYPAW